MLIALCFLDQHGHDSMHTVDGVEQIVSPR